MSKHPLEEILHPRSIAVVGASDSGGRGSGFVSPLVELGYKGNIYPVNPKYPEIMGMKAYPRVSDIPGVVDFVISSIPASGVLDMIDDCAQKGVKAIHLFTARFSETGRKDAAELEREMLRRARKGGIRLIGPNCMGVYYPGEGIAFNNGMPRESGPIGLASQSGQAVGEIVGLAARKGLRFSKAISYGNALDFNEADYLEYFAQDPDTKLILMYIEGVRDGKRFFNALRRATSIKPVVIVKGGRGQSGTRATASHTASLAGSVEVWETAVNQAGAVSASDLDELVDIAAALHFLPPIKGRRVGVAGGSGGSSVLAADQCEEAGLDVIPLPNDIREELKRKGDPTWDWLGNPADFSITMDNFDMAGMLQMMASHPSFDLLIIFMHAPWRRSSRAGQPISIDDHIKNYKIDELKRKPLMIVLQERTWGGNDFDEMRKITEEMRAKVIAAGIPIYPSIGSAARAASKAIDYYQRKKRKK
jgi:acyl-CoA synthetase (NDP forming)